MQKSPPGRLLIVCIRRIGDVLLVTPLIRTFKHHWPKTKVDLLVFKGTESILNSNPDIENIISIDERPDFFQHYQLIKKIFRVYDMSVATLPGDRAILYAYFAANYRVGMLGADKSRWWKRLLLSKAVEFDSISTHTVLMNLRLAEILQISPCSEIVIAWQEKDSQKVTQLIDMNKKIAILHLRPKFSYKEWIKEGWIGLANWLLGIGYTVVLTGDKNESEKKMAAELLDELPQGAIDMVGNLNLNQLGFLLSKAKIYIGPDTVVTHMAAALGTPTMALFGPSNPVKWGPWPKTWALNNPFVRVGSQHRNNVYLMQGSGVCVPCFQEGCDQHINSRSRCLEGLTAQRVINKVKRLINDPENLAT
ncbi:glycosyltransferase family 9 protein [Rickettsiella endosymbiont of Xylota segnis]|uniref:glycosyltransferase family 9 protein n=1 Tax=Rickettsiella endosymbiont of Xylota segnis TaxID=3066238 RepID=UPI0030D37C41